MLSDIAQTFDPLGWLTPVIVSLKCLMKKAWIAKLDWDQKLPGDPARHLHGQTLPSFLVCRTEKQIYGLHLLLIE